MVRVIRSLYKHSRLYSWSWLHLQNEGILIILCLGNGLCTNKTWDARAEERASALAPYIWCSWISGDRCASFCLPTVLIQSWTRCAGVFLWFLRKHAARAHSAVVQCCRCQILSCIQNIKIFQFPCRFAADPSVLSSRFKHCREFGAARGYELAKVDALPALTSQIRNPTSADVFSASYLALAFKIPISYVLKSNLGGPEYCSCTLFSTVALHYHACCAFIARSSHASPRSRFL